MRLDIDGLEIVIDETDTERELADAKETIAELEADAKRAEKEDEAENARVDAMEAELDTLREEMAALKDPTEEGATVATYRERAIAAEKDAETWRGHMRDSDNARKDMARELTALRKRKGVEAGLLAYPREVWGFICALSSPDSARYDRDTFETVKRQRAEAEALRAKIAARV